MFVAAANPDNILSVISQEILQMMTANESLFTSMGTTIYRAFALISIVWFGVETMLSGRGFQAPKFASLVMLLAFGFAMTTYYSTPIPVIGYSFSHLVTDETHSLSTQIEQATTAQVMTAMGNELNQMQTPSVAAILDLMVEIRYFVILFVLTGAELALVVIISFGFAAQAVCVLLGPVFIPFFIVPQLEFLFWGWFKAFLQFSFYSVVANAYVYVFGSALLNFWNSHNQPLTTEYAAEIFVEVVIIQLLFIFGLINAYDELCQYCRFLNSSCDYVIGALVHQVLPRDREFQNWKATPQAGLPSGEVIKTDGRGRRKHTGGDGSPKAVNAA